MPGQKCKQVGVDCVRFAMAVLEEWTGEIGHGPRLAQDTGYHNRVVAMEAMRTFLTSFPNHEDVSSLGEAQPGDVVVLGPPCGGPAHVMIVGPRRNTLWHAGSNVHQAGWVLSKDTPNVLRCYRLRDRESLL